MYYNLPEDFDWEFYLKKNDDLKNAGLKTEVDAVNHYLNYGRFENRVYKNDLPEDFDWEFYLKKNNDIFNDGLNTEEDAIFHYLLLGRFENRLYNDIPIEYENLIDNYNKILTFNGDSYEIFKNHTLNEVEISIIITLFNYEKYIKKSIDSVIKNNFFSYEIIIINDCSTDKSLDIAKKYLKEDINLTIVDKKINTGLIHSRNLGIDVCIGNFVFILDADNYIYENCLNEHYNCIKNSKFISVYSTIDCFDVLGNFIGNISNEDYNFDKLKDGNYIDAMALFNKEKLIDIGKYDQELIKYGIGYEDYELWLRIGSLKLNVCHIKKSLGGYLKKSDSMVNLITPQYYQNILKYLNKKYKIFE